MGRGGSTTQHTTAALFCPKLSVFFSPEEELGRSEEQNDKTEEAADEEEVRLCSEQEESSAETGENQQVQRESRLQSGEGCLGPQSLCEGEQDEETEECFCRRGDGSRCCVHDHKARSDRQAIRRGQCSRQTKFPLHHESSPADHSYDGQARDRLQSDGPRPEKPFPGDASQTEGDDQKVYQYSGTLRSVL